MSLANIYTEILTQLLSSKNYFVTCHDDNHLNIWLEKLAFIIVSIVLFQLKWH
jgi:hypothetical protein